MSYRSYFSLPALTALCGVLLCVGLHTSSVHAYNISEQHAYRVADSLSVFTFTVPITAGSQTLHLPVWGTTGETSERTFGYAFFSDTSSLDLSATAGFVLSDAPVRDGEFVLAPGQQATFTIVLLGVPTATAPPQQVRARITSFPFYLGEDRSPAPYTAAELSNFVTDKVTLP